MPACKGPLECLQERALVLVARPSMTSTVAHWQPSMLKCNRGNCQRIHRSASSHRMPSRSRPRRVIFADPAGRLQPAQRRGLAREGGRNIEGVGLPRSLRPYPAVFCVELVHRKEQSGRILNSKSTETCRCDDPPCVGKRRRGRVDRGSVAVLHGSVHHTKTHCMVPRIKLLLSCRA
jgi:hypothetical protein